jgi:hypothetical protein
MYYHPPMSRPLTTQMVIEKLQQVLHDLSDLSEYGTGEEFRGIVLDEIPLRYRGAEQTSWRVTIELIVAKTRTGKTLTDSDMERLADEAEQGYDVSHLQPSFREGFDEGRPWEETATPDQITDVAKGDAS